jgi:mono/diheme cytochrome c family protein
MKKTVWIALIVLVMTSVLLSACGGSGGSQSTIKRQEPPTDFANMTNPVEGQADAVTAGQQVYTTNCATCHGDKGMGDGAAAASLDPKPANLELTAKETKPQYQHWVITKGGAAAGLSSSMPAFEGVLSDADIWNVVTYLDTTYGK